MRHRSSMDKRRSSNAKSSFSKILRLLIDFLCLGEIPAVIENQPKCEVCAVVWFLTAKLYSAVAIHTDICTMMDQWYGPKRYE